MGDWLGPITADNRALFVNQSNLNDFDAETNRFESRLFFCAHDDDEGGGPRFTLTIQRIGSGSGRVNSTPPGIDCGSDCTQNYVSGTVVTLIATPAPDSIFVGFTGNPDCSGNSVTMNQNITCRAIFDSDL